MAVVSRAQSPPSLFSHVIKRMCTVEMDRAACTSGLESHSLPKSKSGNKRGADDVTVKSTRTGYAQALKDYLLMPRTTVSGRDVNITAPISF
ncbi:hypothetical protein NP493_761g01001 [Ridgeia piscesae]|uniref:Uncharacterized protein n=1 Tax=Ridgeia piscesae TaxID=27915 RepID=A0AAD9KPI2_RIDPI|nr:hypothetical protein NP493_761g01001 [Ridgeia piscesae]